MCAWIVLLTWKWSHLCTKSTSTCVRFNWVGSKACSLQSLQYKTWAVVAWGRKDLFSKDSWILLFLHPLEWSCFLLVSYVLMCRQTQTLSSPGRAQGEKDKAIKERLSTVGKKAFTAIGLANQASLTVWLVWPPAYLIVCCLYCLECAVEMNPII